MLAIKGEIISIDAIGTRKAIAAKIVQQETDYVLAFKGNQSALHGDIQRFLGNRALAKDWAHTRTDTGHGRIEEKTCLATEAIHWLRELHPNWQNLRAIATISSTRVDKKNGQSSAETRFSITSVRADPAAILAATRAHWGIENNLHWQLDITFDEDRCRTRKDFSPLSFAIFRHVVFKLLKQDPSKLSQPQAGTSFR